LGLLFVCLPFLPKPVFSADEHFYCCAGRYQGWQELSDYQLFGSFTVTVEDAKEYLYSFSKTRRVHRFQSFKVNLYI
jgi:hypothetical protein